MDHGENHNRTPWASPSLKAISYCEDNLTNSCPSCTLISSWWSKRNLPYLCLTRLGLIYCFALTACFSIKAWCIWSNFFQPWFEISADSATYRSKRIKISKQRYGFGASYWELLKSLWNRQYWNNIRQYCSRLNTWSIATDFFCVRWCMRERRER